MSPTPVTNGPEHVDVLIVGAGSRGSAPPTTSRPSARKSYAILEAASHRRHLGSVPLPRRSLRLRHVHARLRVQALAGRKGDRRRRIDPGLHARDGRGGTDRRADPLQPPGRRADWSSADARWTSRGRAHRHRRAAEDELWLPVLGSGYYRYDQGYTPEFPGVERSRGPIVHPQHWPEDLDYAGKRVVVIGSGATAVTLVPAMAETAAHVTMLQRSPSYIVSMPAEDTIADALRQAARRELGGRADPPEERRS